MVPHMLISRQLLSQDDATIEDQKAAAASGRPTGMTDTQGDSHTPVVPQGPRRDGHDARVGNGNGNGNGKGNGNGNVNGTGTGTGNGNSYGYGNYEAHPVPYGHVHTREVPDWADMDADAAEDEDDDSGGGPVVDVPDPVHTRPAAMRPSYERQCFRSVILTNLPEGVAHSDITEAIRGGQLLDIHIRADRSAGVSFLLASDAQAFFDHVRRRDLYIKNRRVSELSSVPLMVSTGLDICEM